MSKDLSPYLFDDPHVVVNEEGDVMADPGHVASMNPYRAAGELRNTHEQPVVVNISGTEASVAVAGIKGVTPREQAVAAAEKHRTPDSSSQLDQMLAHQRARYGA